LRGLGYGTARGYGKAAGRGAGHPAAQQHVRGGQLGTAGAVCVTLLALPAGHAVPAAGTASVPAPAGAAGRAVGAGVGNTV
jgi:hypothetical protein